MTTENDSSTASKIIMALVAVLVCCSCVVIAAAGFIFYESQKLSTSNADPILGPLFSDPAAPPTPVELIRTPIELISTDTVSTLLTTEVPENDPYDLACRLQQLCNVPETVPGKSYQVGDTETFWILNSDSVSHNQITARLVYVTPHSYFWADQNADVDESDVKKLMDTFEEKIYPTNQEFFGSEWTPGVDGDEHIFVIYAGGLGSNVGGVYNSSDEYNPQIQPNSNAHESFVISSNQSLAGE